MGEGLDKEDRKRGVMTQGNLSRVVQYITEEGETSKTKTAQDLKLSMPTVLQIYKTLLDMGIAKESGEFESTGGRKAKSIIICADYRYALGLDITARHISIVIVDMRGQVVKNVRKRIAFEPTENYYRKVKEEIKLFVAESKIDAAKILGTGVSIAGIVDNEKKLLVKSHTLDVANLDLKAFEEILDGEVYFENDANAAMMAEKIISRNDTIYISLSNTVGGAIYIDKKIYRGMAMKAGEVGHVTLHPGGRKCYCGKKGCADSYLSALNLKTSEDMTLEEFMEALAKKDEGCIKIWDQYLDELALLIVNLRTIFDAEIIIGGYVGYYIEDYLEKLGEKILKISTFDSDISFLHAGVHKAEASATGVASHFLEKFIYEL
ncbi:MAG: ROK family protein [Lachnospiraceae bacterium]|nr:ROK family protein [Lachnospiraceae bacterium]